MSDYSFMKTGLVGESASLASEESVKRLISIVITMVVESEKTAMSYCEHQGRTTVTVQDIQKGLRYQARNFLFAEDTEKNVNEMHELLFADDDEDMEEEDMEEEDGDHVEDGDDDEWEDVEDDVRTCECDTCTKIRECDDKWDEWAPEDKIGQFIKNSLDKASHLRV